MQVTALVAGFTDSRSSATWKGKKTDRAVHLALPDPKP